MAKILSGAIEGGVTSPDEVIRQLASIGIGNQPWTVQLANVGGTANVIAYIGPTATGPWTPVLDLTGADGAQSSDVTSRWFIRVRVVSGTTDAGFEANVG